MAKKITDEEILSLYDDLLKKETYNKIEVARLMFSTADEIKMGFNKLIDKQDVEIKEYKLTIKNLEIQYKKLKSQLEKYKKQELQYALNSMEVNKLTARLKDSIPKDEIRKSIEWFETLLYKTGEMGKEDRAKLTRKFDLLPVMLILKDRLKL